MAMSGMNTESLRGVVSQLTQQSEELKVVARKVDSLLQVARENWRGDDVRQFESKWADDYLRTCAQLEEHLAELARTLSKNIQDQERTSATLAGDGGGLGSAGLVAGAVLGGAAVGGGLGAAAGAALGHWLDNQPGPTLPDIPWDSLPGGPLGLPDFGFPQIPGPIGLPDFGFPQIPGPIGLPDFGSPRGPWGEFPGMDRFFPVEPPQIDWSSYGNVIPGGGIVGQPAAFDWFNQPSGTLSPLQDAFDAWGAGIPIGQALNVGLSEFLGD